jgi:Flp pilus assembly protein TadG
MLSRLNLPKGSKRRRSRRSRTRGAAEVIEFTLVFLPLMAMTTVLVDTAWAVFAKSTLQRAVREGVRTGVTLTQSQMAQGACLTDTVKGIVQSNSLGVLHGSSGLSKIQVHYYLPPAPNSTAAATDVSGQTNGDAPGNIMVVSVNNYSLIPLLPRVYQWNMPIDDQSISLSVSSADLIEPSANPPCIGTAP